MTLSMGRVVAELAEPGQEIPAELVELINVNIKPPARVSADDVYIRAMYIVSDQVNSFGGRFPVEEHSGLAQLLVDSPVLVGHRKDQLPVARTFHATTVDRDGRPWVKSYFYWLKLADRAEEFCANLDGGIYKECSIAFTFHLPECSICGKDIRRCQHQPFESYDHAGSSEPCHFNYRQVERVLETSLVYRGAVPNTAVVKELGDTTGDIESSVIASPEWTVEPVLSLADIGGSSDYLVIPRYVGLQVSAAIDGDRLTLTQLDGKPIRRSDHFGPIGLRWCESLLGILVGQRGKERCSVEQLEDYLEGRTSPVTRLVLHLLPSQGMVTLPRVTSRSRNEIRLMPYRIATRERLEHAVMEVMTKDGVEIHPVGAQATALVAGKGYWYRPPSQNRRRLFSSELTLRLGDGLAHLTLRSSGSTLGRGDIAPLILDLADFDLSKLTSGKRFLARRSGPLPGSVWRGRTLTGHLNRITQEGDAWRFNLSGDLTGSFVLRPIKLKGEDHFLFGRLSEGTNAGEAA